MKNLNETNKVILLILIIINISCYEVEDFEEYKDMYSENLNVEKCHHELDRCDGNEIVYYDVDEDCNTTEEREYCEYGCRDAGPNEDVRCFEPCEVNNCNTPEPNCESSLFLTAYNKSTCVVNDNGLESCVINISTRHYCGCVDETELREAHCYGDYSDEI